MSEYKYTSEHERECTEKYEGIYTDEEAELNRRLQDECYRENIDLAVIEELLKQGADPNGATASHGWDVLDHVYGEIICDSHDSNSINLPQITELFLKYGMDLDNPKVPYDYANKHSMWNFAFVLNENAIFALKQLLDHGLSADSFAEFWGHAFFNFFNVDRGSPATDKEYCYSCTWALKMLFLGASYSHVLNEDDDLREFICCEYNSYDLCSFRDWDRFEYRFDTSGDLYGAIVSVYDKETGRQVWRMGMGYLGRETLAQLGADPV